MTRSLRARLTALGFVAIYAPLLLLLGVDLVTDEEVTTVTGTGTVVTETGGGSAWPTVTVVLLAPVALGLAWWWAGRATGPLDRLRRVADDIGATDLDRRIGLDRGPTEVVALATSFDAMLDRLEQASATQRRLVEETSHALRTPLAVLTTNAEVLLADGGASPDDHRAGWERTLATARRMAATVDDLLVEARGRARSVERVPTDLAATVGDVVAEAGVVAASAGVTVRRTGADRAVLPIDAPTVRRAVANLLDNAVRLSPPGSAVDVHVDGAVVVVTDHGPGLTEEEQAQAFDRFWRGPRAGPGSGLGLSIAAQVAEAHGGSLTVASPGPSGDGAAFTLALAPGARAGQADGGRSGIDGDI